MMRLWRVFGSSASSDPEALERSVRFVRHLRWTVPIFLSLIALFFEVWEHLFSSRYEEQRLFNFSAEVLVFGLLGPVLIFLILTLTTRFFLLWKQALVYLHELNQNLEHLVAERTRELEAKNEALERANQELRQLDRLKSDFIALVSHELVTPLTTINGGLELLLQGREMLPSDVQQRLAFLQGEVARLTRLVGRILQVSRLEAGKLHLNCGPVALRPLLQRVVDSLVQDRRVDLLLSDHLPPLWADEIYLEEMLRNLIGNAVKYTPSGSPIHIRVVQRSPQSVDITITDHGPGIPPEKQQQLFIPFSQIVQGERRESSGWGLGLYLTRRLAELHGGRLWVESPVWEDSEGPGTCFHLELPIAPDIEPDEDAVRAQEEVTAYARNLAHRR